jgi:hypothetical protein
MAFLTDNLSMTYRPLYDPRPYAMPVPTTGIFDTPVVCVSINRTWIPHIVGVLNRLEWADAWDAETHDEIANAIQQIRQLMLALATTTCEDSQMTLRQNPSNPYLLEQSSNGGITWSIAYDYALISAASVVNTTQTTINQLGDNYDGTPESIAPDMNYDGTSGDDIRNAALWDACVKTVQATCNAVQDLRNREAAGAALGVAVLGATAVVLTATGVGIPLALTLSTAALAVYASAWGELSESILQDESVQYAVACCMYSALADADITRTAFSSSLDACAFAALSPESQLAGAIATTISDDLDVYLTFLDAMQTAHKYAELSLLPSSPCNAAFDSLFDFTLSTASWRAFTPDSARAVWDSAGWHRGNTFRNRLQIESDFTFTAVVTQLRVTVASPFTMASTATEFFISISDSSGTVLTSQTLATANQLIAASYTIDLPSPLSCVDATLFIGLSNHTSPSNTNAIAYGFAITTVAIEGNGSIAFAAR